MIQSKRLGQGLDIFFGGDEPEPAVLRPPAGPAEKPAGPYREIPVDRVDPNPFQPRTEFDETGLAELADSIERQGLFQPVLVRARGERFELVAGERRLRAFRRLGRSTVPAIVRDIPDEKLLLAALLENLQRKDLNPIEKAKAFRGLLSRSGRTQEEIALDLGIDRSTLSNFIRLLDLPEEIQAAVSRGTLSMGHARALLSAPSSQRRAAVYKRILTEQLSVRATERLLAPPSIRPKLAGKGSSDETPTWVGDIEEKMRVHLGTKVRIEHNKANERGTITIEYFGNQQLNDMLNVIGIIL